MRLTGADDLPYSIVDPAVFFFYCIRRKQMHVWRTLRDFTESLKGCAGGKKKLLVETMPKT